MAGIDPGVVQTSKNAFSTKSFHGLRHSFASALANSGVPADLRMKLTGHNSAEIHQTYTHLELQVLRGAIESLPRLGHLHPEDDGWQACPLRYDSIHREADRSI